VSIVCCNAVTESERANKNLRAATSGGGRHFAALERRSKGNFRFAHPHGTTGYADMRLLSSSTP
jgi:hypothetical protein